MAILRHSGPLRASVFHLEGRLIRVDSVTQVRSTLSDTYVSVSRYRMSGAW